MNTERQVERAWDRFERPLLPPNESSRRVVDEDQAYDELRQRKLDVEEERRNKHG